MGKKDGQKFTCFAQEAVVKRRVVGGRFGTDIESFRATQNVSGKTGGGLDAAGGTDGDEDGTNFQFCEDLLQMKWHLAKPADVRTYLAAAGAERNFALRFVD